MQTYWLKGLSSFKVVYFRWFYVELPIGTAALCHKVGDAIMNLIFSSTRPQGISESFTSKVFEASLYEVFLLVQMFPT